MSGTYSFNMYNGEDFDRTLTWSTSIITVSLGDTPVNLTGYTASLTLGSVQNFITTTSSANGLTTLGGTAGTIRLFIPAFICAQFSGTSISYRLFTANSSPETSCLLAGSF